MGIFIMLKLYQFERKWGIPNLGPFCCKTETYLRMANIAYEIKVTLPSEAPKGKLPYIEDGGEVLADSGFIVLHLKTKYKDLDIGLNPAELALSVAMQRLLEEHLYWGIMFSRWQYTGANWLITKEAMFGMMPPNIRELTAVYYHHTIKQQIHGHGMGRHNAEEIFSLGKQDIDALAACLGDKKYFLGNTPTTLDTSAFGILINTIGCPIESQLKEYGLSKTNLVNFIHRIKAEYYPELQAV
jgi:glutathione S-transferase